MGFSRGMVHNNSRHRTWLIGFVGTCLSCAMVNESAAQGPLRRLGSRVRENIQRIPAAPSIQAPPAAPRLQPQSQPGAAAPVDPRRPSPAAANLGGSNYNSPQTSPRVNPGSTGVRPLDPASPTTSARVPLSAAAGVPGQDGQDSQVLSATDAQAYVPGASAKLGVIVDNPPPRIGPDGLPRRTRGALVVGTKPGSIAEKAGFTDGDIIVSVNGTMVDNVAQMVGTLARANPAEPLQLNYLRNGKVQQATVRLGDQGRVVPASATRTDPVTESGESILMKNPAEAPNSARSGVTPPPPPAGTSPAPNGLGGLGRAIGGWLGGNASSQAANGPRAGGPRAGNGAPNVPATEDDYLPLAMSEEPSLTVEPALEPSQTEPETELGAELLPPPVAAASAQAERPATIPTTVNPRQQTIRSLLEQIEALRRQVEQLEAEQTAPAP